MMFQFLDLRKTTLPIFFIKLLLPKLTLNLSRTRNTGNSVYCSSFEGVIINKAYENKIPISKKKYEDLMFLVRSNAIIKNHSDFYKTLNFVNNN